MTTPRDHHDDEHTELIEPYLRSFRDDAVPPYAKRRAMMALGLGVATATSSTAVAAVAVGGLGRAGAIAVIKSLVGGAVAGAVVLGASSYVQERPGARPRAAVTAAAQTATPVLAPRAAREPRAALVDEPSPPAELQMTAVDPAELRRPPAAARPREQPSMRVEPSSGQSAPEPARLAASAAPPAVPQASPGDVPGSALGREVLVLDEARAALAERDASAAQALLDRYAREFPGGHLQPEAVLLRIEALVLAGEMGSAQAVAEQFERAHPGDSHLFRIRSLLSGGPAAR